MWRDDAWVLDMLHACQRALRYAKGLTGAAFLSDELRQDAIIRFRSGSRSPIIPAAAER